MSYRYEDEKAWLFTDEGQRALFKANKTAVYLFDKAGAANGMNIVADAGAYDTFKMMAVLDRLVELGEIVEVTSGVRGQDRIFRSRS